MRRKTAACRRQAENESASRNDAEERLGAASATARDGGRGGFGERLAAWTWTGWPRAKGGNAAESRAKAAAAIPATAPQPTVRKNFADTAFWTAILTTNKDGLAEVSFNMPDQLTAWKIRVWGMGHGTKVGQGEAEVVTKKDLIVRLQAPRFFMQKDEVVLSANVHNYLKAEKKIRVSPRNGRRHALPPSIR